MHSDVSQETKNEIVRKKDVVKKYNILFFLQFLCYNVKS